MAPDSQESDPEKPVKCPDLECRKIPGIIARIEKIPDYIILKRPPRSGLVFVSTTRRSFFLRNGTKRASMAV